MQIIVKTLRGQKWALEVQSSTSIRDIKAMLEHVSGIPVTKQRLLFRRKALDDESQSVSDCEIAGGSMLHCLLRVGGPLPQHSPSKEEMPRASNDSVAPVSALQTKIDQGEKLCKEGREFKDKQDYMKALIQYGKGLKVLVEVISNDIPKDSDTELSRRVDVYLAEAEELKKLTCDPLSQDCEVVNEDGEIPAEVTKHTSVCSLLGSINGAKRKAEDPGAVATQLKASKSDRD